jgi:hypothetical protein
VGNAAVLGSFTSLQLKTALSDETGSGAAVFADTPTLVTPLLGTPTSGVLTNCTGTAAGLTAGTVTTNANLTGHVTSVGNAAVLGSFTMAQLNTALSDGDVQPLDADLTTLAALGNWKVAYTDGSSAQTALALGAAGTVLQSAGAAAAPTFARAWTCVLKTSDTARASTTVLADDPTLVLSCSASTTYKIRIKAFYKIANATMDFKYGFAYSSTTTGDITSDLKTTIAGAAAGTAAEIQGVSAAIVGSTSILSTASGTGRIELDFVFTTNGAGTFSFQWAQNTSDVGNATVLKGSMLEWMIVA